MFIRLKRYHTDTDRKVVPTSNAGKVMMKILAKPANMAAQAITVTAQPRIPTLNQQEVSESGF